MKCSCVVAQRGGIVGSPSLVRHWTTVQRARAYEAAKRTKGRCFAFLLSKTFQTDIGVRSRKGISWFRSFNRSST